MTGDLNTILRKVVHLMTTLMTEMEILLFHCSQKEFLKGVTGMQG